MAVASCELSLAGGWDSFADRADDDVLLLAFGYLHAAQVLTLAAASASAAVRLAGQSTGGICAHGECVGSQRPTVAQRLAAAHMSGPEKLARAAAAAAAATIVHPSSRSGCVSAATDSDCTGREFVRPCAVASWKPVTLGGVGGPLVALRALASGTPASETLRLATALVASRRGRDGDATRDANATVHVENFLDAFFRSEVQRLADRNSSATTSRDPSVAPKRRANRKWAAAVAAAKEAPTAAADAALTTFLDSVEGGTNIALFTAEAIRASERELDCLVDEGHVGAPGVYEAIARRRSAAEFLRGRLDAVGGPEVAEAKQSLDEAVASLDETVMDYTKEGYVLACPRLTGGVMRCAVPYAHWWVHLERSHAQGWAVLR